MSPWHWLVGALALIGLGLALFGPWPARAQEGISCASERVAFRTLPDPDKRYTQPQAERIMAVLAARAGNDPLAVSGAVEWRRHQTVLVLWRMPNGYWCRLSPNPMPEGLWNSLRREALGRGA